MDNVMSKQFYFVHLGGSYHAMPCFGPWLVNNLPLLSSQIDAKVRLFEAL
jgi:hypothetical protein